MTINLNREPYYDDYNEGKEFYNILFRPGFAVQTRELNQIQTLLQKQIERFGDHIFREGSIVLGGAIDLQTRTNFVRVTNLDTDANPVDSLIGKEVVGTDSELIAYVITAITDDGIPVLYVRYLNSNESDETEFRVGEELTIQGTSDTFNVRSDEDEDLGRGSIFSIEDGVCFVRGYFVSFPSQTIVLDKYDTTPTLAIGFRVQDPIITANEDSSLLDNAQGTFNFAAPGANRLVLSLSLTTTDIGTSESDTDFVLLAEVEDGLIAENRERTQYAKVYEEIAKRTADESGDYYVRGLTVRTREALDTGSNEGLDPNGDPDRLSVDIEAGLAYVKGYEINKRTTSHELIDKGIDFKYVNNAIVTARTGGFVVVNEIVGSLDTDEAPSVNLYDTAESRVTNDTNVTASPTGNLIGTARVKTLVYNSGDLGTPDGALQLYLFDIDMNDGFVISDTNAIQSSTFFADVSENLVESIDNTLIYKIGTSSTRKLRSDTSLENNTDTSYSFYTTQAATISQNTDEITITSSEPLDYSIGTLSALERREIFVSVDSALGSPNNLEAGAHLDLSDPSVSIEVTSTTTMTIDLGDTFTAIESPTAVTVTYKARRAAIFESSKILVPDVYVKIGFDQSGAPDTSGPIPLGFSDVFRIDKIYRKTSDGGADPFGTEESGDDVTNLFLFDNGQRDNFYDHSTITPRGITLSGDDWLLVKLSYFKSSTHSYFSVDSYPIDDTQINDDTIFTYQIPEYETSFGEVYNLRDSLDFRPVKEATATEAESINEASVNPDETNNFINNQTSNKLLIPFPSSSITFDYSYYLARRDIITLDKNGNFGSIRGKPSFAPVTPSIPENLMGIAQIFIPPFPSISQTFGRILRFGGEICTHEKIAQRRYTMRDIGAMNERINNLEYYNSLNLLEKDTADIRILDEDGNDRFKNGFLADGFLDHSLGATTNDDYNIAIDREEQLARPVFELDSFGYDYNESQSSLEKIGNLVHLPVESEEVLVGQLSATTIRNVEQSVYRFLGNLELDPDNDTWVDETTVDKNVEFGDDLPSDKIVTTDWGSWERSIVGSNLFARNMGDRSGIASRASFVGSYSSYADALRASNGAGKYGRNRTLIEKIAADQREGIRTTINFEKETQELGNFVTDVSVVPYIRPQAINFYASGIKPRTRHYFFFDGEDVTEYVRQYESVEDADTFTTEGSPIRSNEFGEIRGVLYLPTEGKRFRTGSKEVVISDNPTDSLEDITSRAETSFIASGLNVQRQNTTLSTKIPTSSDSEEVFETRNRRAAGTKVIGPSCIAYTFRLDLPSEEEGAFVTSLDLFFQQFHPELGFRVQIRELNSGGNITQSVLPYSEVWTDRKVRDAQGNRIDNPILQTSEDGTAPTNIEFKAPVFLYNETSYAIVVSAENINPDTYLWISRIGETDVATQEPITSRRLTGAIYTTNNSVNWDIVPQADLKFRIYRAKFAKDQEYVGTLNNKPYEFLDLENVESTYTNIGERILGSDIVRVTLTSGSVSEGNEIEGDTSNVSGDVVLIDGEDIYTTAIGLQQGESITFTDNGSTVAEGTIDTVVRGDGILRKFVPGSNRMILERTNGRFFEGARLRGANSDIESFIDTLGTFPYSTTTLKPDFINFQDTSVSFEKRGRLSTDNTFGPFEDGNEENTTVFDEEYNLLSRSTEIADFGEDSSSTDLRITMSSTSEYVSPIVDLSRANSVYVHNLINDDTTGETDPRGGNLLNKYITKVVTLDEGQDAEDIKLFLSVYRPPSKSSVENDIRVWMRVRNGEDPQPLNDRPWFEMVSSNNNFSSPDNAADFIETEFDVPEANLNGSGIVTYDTNIGDQSVTLSSFKQYQIKIGLVGVNSAIVPKVADLRAIALQK